MLKLDIPAWFHQLFYRHSQAIHPSIGSVTMCHTRKFLPSFMFVISAYPADGLPPVVTHCRTVAELRPILEVKTATQLRNAMNVLKAETEAKIR